MVKSKKQFLLQDPNVGSSNIGSRKRDGGKCSDRRGEEGNLKKKRKRREKKKLGGRKREIPWSDLRRQGARELAPS